MRIIVDAMQEASIDRRFAICEMRERMRSVFEKLNLGRHIENFEKYDRGARSVAGALITCGLLRFPADGGQRSCS